MKKIILLMLIVFCVSSCQENVSVDEGNVYVVENVSVSPTTITFKFKGVEKTQTFSLVSCQDERGKFPSYKKGEIVKVENNRISHLTETPNFYIVVFFLIGFIIGRTLGGSSGV